MHTVNEETEPNEATKMLNQQHERPHFRRLKSIGAEVLPNTTNYIVNADKGGRKLISRPTLEQLLEGKVGRDEVDSKREKMDAEAGGVAAEGDGEDKEEQGGKVIKFGWFQGVYMRCLLNIWGVMLFLRLTWVIGQAGLIEGLLLITLANSVTIITTISMSAVSTNGQIAAGGIYYMISRSLGPEFGGAIGLMFTLANSIAVAMYTIGFCESLLDMLYQYITDFNGIVDSVNRVNDVRVIGVVTLILVLGLAIVGMDWVTRVQMLLLGLLIVSQVDFVVGSFLTPSDDKMSRGFVGYSLETLERNMYSNYTTDPETGTSESFFSVFAVFFPAVTGIVAGANLSGDLKDPGVAIPKGTLLAIGTTYVSYFIYGVIVAACSLRYASGVPEEVHFGTPEFNHSFTDILNVTRAFDDCSDRDCQYGSSVSQQLMETISAYGPLIYSGCFAATLSSAIASLVGAPRVFQAVAKDKLFPYIESFSRGYGANNDPVRGYILVFIIALVCIIIGDLNVVSSLLSNFFVAAYALINFSVFHADITNSPGWRPSFKYYNKYISLIGTVQCVAVMFLMDYITALITLICIGCLYMVIHIRAPNVNWGSSTQSQSFMVALQSIQALSKVEDHVKNYRPKILLISGNPGDRPLLMDFASLLTKKLSLLQCVRVNERDHDFQRLQLCRDLGNSWLKSNHVRAFYHVTRAECLSQGVRQALELCGLGKMSPNMLMFGFKSKWLDDYATTEEYFNTLVVAFNNKCAIGILRVHGGLDASELYGTKAILKAFTQSKDDDDSDDSEVEDERAASPEVDEEKAAGSSPPATAGTPAAMPLFPTPFFRNPLNKEHQDIVARMKQFRGKTSMQGTIDIYWLYDDGGLTLLLPHLMRSQPKFNKCPLRLFFLSENGTDCNIETETKRMADMVAKFRIEVKTVALLKDIGNTPSKKSEEAFEQIVKKVRKQASRSEGSSHVVLPDEELAVYKEKTDFHLRLGEIMREKSKSAAMVVMTLPMPTKKVTPAPLYMAWMDIVSQDMPPFLFLRGNQESVLTFYS